MPDDDAAVIRLADVYREQIAATVQLAMINTQLAQLPDHEIRIRALERWRYSLPVATLAAIASAGAAIAAAFHHG